MHTFADKKLLMLKPDDIIPSAWQPRKNFNTYELQSLADSIAATPGCDVNGPTALIKSVLSSDQKNCLSGNVMQMKFTKNLFNTERGIAAFIALAKTYFAGGGGQQLSINVLSREELLDAKAHPENYKDLIVRVGGYSDYFVRLPEGLRDNVIARTEIGL